MRTARHKVYCAVKGTSGSVDPTDEALPIMSERLGIAGDENEEGCGLARMESFKLGSLLCEAHARGPLALTRRTTVDLLVTK